MNNRFYRSLHPFFLAGLFIVLAVIAVFIFSYLFLAALIVGAILYALSWLQRLFFNQSTPPADGSTQSKHKPVTYENGEF